MHSLLPFQTLYQFSYLSIFLGNVLQCFLLAEVFFGPDWRQLCLLKNRLTIFWFKVQKIIGLLPNHYNSLTRWVCAKLSRFCRCRRRNKTRSLRLKTTRLRTSCRRRESTCFLHSIRRVANSSSRSKKCSKNHNRSRKKSRRRRRATRNQKRRKIRTKINLKMKLTSSNRFWSRSSVNKYRLKPQINRNPNSRTACLKLTKASSNTKNNFQSILKMWPKSLKLNHKWTKEINDTWKPWPNLDRKNQFWLLASKILCLWSKNSRSMSTKKSSDFRHPKSMKFCRNSTTQSRTATMCKKCLTLCSVTLTTLMPFIMLENSYVLRATTRMPMSSFRGSCSSTNRVAVTKLICWRGRLSPNINLPMNDILARFSWQSSSLLTFWERRDVTGLHWNTTNFC